MQLLVLPWRVAVSYAGCNNACSYFAGLNGTVDPIGVAPRLNKPKLLKRVLSGSRNVRFEDFVKLIEGFGFRLSRVSGSHHIFVHPRIPELVNLQSVDGQAKPYQINQWLRLIERYNLRMEDDS